MLVLSSRILDVPILSLQTGSPIAHTTSAIIDPRRLHIIAFFCDGPQLGFDKAIIHTADIREFSNIGIIIDSSDDIMPPDDLVRLQEILEYDFKLMGCAVIDTHSHKLGKVIDYTTDSVGFTIQKLTVKRPLLKALNDTELIVDRSQIVEVSVDQIVVRSATVEDKAKSATAPVVGNFENPFRAKPQPETH